ncbi:hypothetical protein [Sphingobacterium multivorum]|uniref:hypothetical protein n=1 Tax=Sphingobacterium TaxID=28453 RepID=UPI0028A04DE8|nr:hypothetical protein [Sphingobacterium multivorum]
MSITLPNFSSTSIISSTERQDGVVININEENKKFINYIENKVQPIFYSLINTDDLDLDVMTPAEEILRELLSQNFSATITWFNDFFVSIYNSDKMLLNILKILGNLEEYLVKKFAIVIALSGFSHKNMEIREMSIRAFENWGSIDSLTTLKKQSLSPDWLDEYRLEVIKNIEEDLCLS